MGCPSFNLPEKQGGNMMNSKIDQSELLVIADEEVSSRDNDRRGIDYKEILGIKPINLGEFKDQVNNFIGQLDFVMKNSPNQEGAFKLDTIEVSASVLIQAKGGVKLALLAKAEASAQINPCIKFVFKK